jgi:hypothetical protein
MPVPLIVGIEPPEFVGEDDVPISVGVVTELEALVMEDEVGVVLVVLPSVVGGGGGSRSSWN